MTSKLKSILKRDDSHSSSSQINQIFKKVHFSSEREIRYYTPEETDVVHWENPNDFIDLGSSSEEDDERNQVDDNEDTEITTNIASTKTSRSTKTNVEITTNIASTSTSTRPTISDVEMATNIASTSTTSDAADVEITTNIANTSTKRSITDVEMEVKTDRNTTPTKEQTNKSIKRHKLTGSSALRSTYEVEKILGRMIENGKKKYLIKWKGYSIEHSSWEPEDHLDSTLQLMK